MGLWRCHALGNDSTALPEPAPPLYWQLANTMSNSVREKMIFFMVVTFLFV